MKKTLIDKLTNRLTAIKFENLPVYVIDKVKASILDCFACVIGGYDLPWSKTSLTTFREFGETPNKDNLRVWLYGDKLPLPFAAFCNSVMAHSIIQEETHAESRSHPGTVIIPATFAVAESTHANGREIIEAIVRGYEAMGKVGAITSRDFFDYHGYRPSGLYGPFGAAASTASLLKLDLVRFKNALSIAAGFSSGINEWAHAASWELYFHNGNASKNGIISAFLAKNGAKGADTILEGKHGFLMAFGGIEPGTLTEFIDDGQLEIEKTYFKHYPSSAFSQETIEATIKLKKNYQFKYSDVENISVHSYYLAKNYPGCDEEGPYESILHAQTSTKFAMAAVILDGDINLERYKHFNDNRIYILSKKINTHVDPIINQMFPEIRRSRVTIRLKNGKEISTECADLKPLDLNDIERRFRKYSLGIIPPVQVEKIIYNVMNLENIDDIREITSLFSPQRDKVFDQ